MHPNRVIVVLDGVFMKRMIPLAVLLALLNGCASHQDDVQNNVKPVADAEPTVITVSSDDYKLVWSGTDAVIKWNNGTSKRCHLFDVRRGVDYAAVPYVGTTLKCDNGKSVGLRQIEGSDYAEMLFLDEKGGLVIRERVWVYKN